MIKAVIFDLNGIFLQSQNLVIDLKMILKSIQKFLELNSEK